ncbi:unnamed protein product [Acanthoscelides obtectus]|nr:unnamed protein product [Acanthoscelides obtectus]CAK1621197.1 hypothetical protein AOBTE_LOCUS828 [Acanthoscelides obtectus]
MGGLQGLLLVLFLQGLLGSSHVQAINNRFLPDSFKIGVANAAPQIEGAWNEGGKGETIWDRFAMTRPEMIIDRSTPEVACDSYHRWREDLAIIKGLNSQFYRLSIAWSRILPTGYYNGSQSINQEGVRYYKTLLRALNALDIEPMVTLYHWDLPQQLQDDFGGWLSPKVADLFAEYARLCYELFGDEIRWWITINEPKQVCEAGYGVGVFAPGIFKPGEGNYICAKNVLLAHAKAYRIYDEEFRATNKGKVAMVIDTPWFEPGSQRPDDVAAAERARLFMYGLYGHPIYYGDWPEIVKDRVALRSYGEGLEVSRLPEFTPEEKELIKGTHDYLTINYYATHMANATGEAPFDRRSTYDDMNIIEWLNPAWPKGGPDWFSIWPMGLRKVLNWLKETYGDHEIVITENGLSDNTGDIQDPHRIQYIRDHLSACLDAIYEDNVRLVGYMAWSFMDDWEWTGGYGSRIGMYYVDYNSPNRTRTRKASALYFREVCKNRCLVANCV